MFVPMWLCCHHLTAVSGAVPLEDLKVMFMQQMFMYKDVYQLPEFYYINVYKSEALLNTLKCALFS